MHLFLLICTLVVTHSTTIEVQPFVTTTATTLSQRLLPRLVSGLRIYTDWLNTTTNLGNPAKSYQISYGNVNWPPPVNRDTKFAVISKILSTKDVKQALKILKKLNFDVGLDSVDAMPTHEMYIHKGPIDDMSTEDIGYRSRKEARRQLKRIFAPAEARITEYVRRHFPKVCGDGVNTNRKCRACYSLTRKYVKEGRQSHMMHRDGQALVTAVVSLSDHGRDFTGGLYVAANGQGRQSIAMQHGDVVLHQYDLLHGVQVENVIVNQKKIPTERWSWIMWFKDSETCQQHGHEWSRECAENNDALCQYTYGWRIHLDETLNKKEKDFQREYWMTKSAQNGFAEAMFKVGRNHLGRQNMTGANYWFRKAIAENDPDASYQVGHLLLLGLLKPTFMIFEDRVEFFNNGTIEEEEFYKKMLIQVIDEEEDSIKARDKLEQILIQREALVLFENAAKWGSSPFAGAPFAMYNLGVAWLYGYGGLQRNPKIAVKWFQKSGLPEGLMAMSLYKKSMGHKKAAKMLKKRAIGYGFGNRPSRDQGLFGLHSAWPKGPPEW